jgi:hypothetical protein
MVDAVTGASARRARKAQERAQADATGRQLAQAASEAARLDEMTGAGTRRRGRRALTFLGTEPQSLG